MKSGKTISSLLLLTAAASAQLLNTGDAFPALEGKSLTSKIVRLPDAARGKPAVVISGFARPAGYQSMIWAKRFLKDFNVDRTPIYQVPIVERAPRLIRPLIVRGLKSEVTPNLHDFVFLVYANEAAWKQRLGFERDEVSHVVVLDAEGRVVRRHTGNYTEIDYRGLADALRSLAPAIKTD